MSGKFRQNPQPVPCVSKGTGAWSFHERKLAVDRRPHDFGGRGSSIDGRSWGLALPDVNLCTCTPDSPC